jgi:hypothetical protein
MCFGSRPRTPPPPASAPPPPEDTATAPEIDATDASKKMLITGNRLGRNSLRIDPVASSEGGTGLAIPA